MANPNPTPVDPLFTVALPYSLNTVSFKDFIEAWRERLADEKKKRVFSFGEKAQVQVPLHVLPVRKQDQELIKIRLAVGEVQIGVFITPDNLYAVGFVVCQSEQEYALFDTSKHLLTNPVNADDKLLQKETYDKMGGFIKDDLDGNILANKLIDAIEGLGNPGSRTIDELGKKMGVIVQVIIEPIRFKILQEQYIRFFSANELRVASRTPINVSTDNEGGSGQNDTVASDPVQTQASGPVTVEVRGCKSDSVHEYLEKDWESLSRIALEAYENDKYKQKGYELEGVRKTYVLKNNDSITFQTIQDLLKALGMAKEKSQELEEEKGSSSTSKSSKIKKIASYFPIPKKLRGKGKRK